MKDYYLTDKVKLLIKNAEMISDGTVRPIDLFIGAALVKKGTLFEMYFLMEEKMHFLLNIQRDKSIRSASHKDFSALVTPETEEMWTKALGIMEGYNQVYLNEGHVIKAFYNTWTEAEQNLLAGLPHNKIRDCVTSARDLLVCMEVYNKKHELQSDVTIRRAAKSDEERLLQFVIENFGQPWKDTLKNGFQQDEIPIFLAWRKGALIGFSSYDVYKNQKGIYGPMGVSKSERKSGAGRLLLQEALQDMKEKGYAYIILGEAGPIEYYEKECGAVIIPMVGF